MLMDTPRAKKVRNRGLYFETLEREFSENAPDAEPATGLIAKSVTEEQDWSGSTLPPKK